VIWAAALIASAQTTHASVAAVRAVRAGDCIFLLLTEIKRRAAKCENTPSSYIKLKSWAASRRIFADHAQRSARHAEVPRPRHMINRNIPVPGV
jgi:hypothetical protein